MNEIDPASLQPWVAWGGFLLAFIFGYIGNKTHFCTMGAIADIVNMGDWQRLRMWLLAIAVAILGASALELAGFLKLSNSIYTAPRLPWLAFSVGGFLFGIGMVLGSGCGSKTLIRVGTGNLKSVVVAVFLAISAYMTLRGVLAPLRVGVLEPLAIQFAGNQDLPTILADALGFERSTMLIACSLIISTMIAAIAFRRPETISAELLLGGIVVGLVVVGGWYVTGHLGYLAENPKTLEPAWIATNTGKMESLTFVGPQAFLLELLMFWTDQSRIVTFGIASVAGVVLGSACFAVVSRTFRFEAFRDVEDMLNHIAGGILMGFGGITALGCTIGQAITGISTLAIGSFLVFAMIILGATVGLKYQYWRIA